MGDERRDFDAIWREVGPTLWRAVFAYSGGRRDITDDAVTEAFARAIERADTIREPKPYLYRVAFRIAAAELREDWHRPDREMPIEDRHVLADLAAALARLSPSQQAAVYLHYVADLPSRKRLHEILSEWRAAYAKLSADFSTRTFENDLSSRWGLTTP